MKKLQKICWSITRSTLSVFTAFEILLTSALMTPSWGMKVEKELESENNTSIVISPSQLSRSMINNINNNNDFTPPILDELCKRFYLVHKTQMVPQEPTLYPAGIHKPYTHNLEKPTCPFTVHWTIFSDLEWTNGNFNIAIISPFFKLQKQILIFSFAEIVTIGPYSLGPEDSILIPDNTPIIPI